MPEKIANEIFSKFNVFLKSFSFSYQSIFTGPIPDPDSLAKYKEISSDLPDRIVTMAEKEQEERFRENKRRYGLFKFVIRAVTIIVVACVGFSFYLLRFSEPPHKEWWIYLLPLLAYLVPQIAGIFRRSKVDKD